MGGKGGGKPESAQASGPNIDSLNLVVDTAEKYALTALKLTGTS